MGVLSYATLDPYRRRWDEYGMLPVVQRLGVAYSFWIIVIPAKARDYGITGVGLSVCLSVCYHDN